MAGVCSHCVDLPHWSSVCSFDQITWFGHRITTLIGGAFCVVSLIASCFVEIMVLFFTYSLLHVQPSKTQYKTEGGFHSTKNSENFETLTNGTNVSWKKNPEFPESKPINGYIHAIPGGNKVDGTEINGNSNRNFSADGKHPTATFCY